MVKYKNKKIQHDLLVITKQGLFQLYVHRDQDVIISRSNVFLIALYIQTIQIRKTDLIKFCPSSDNVSELTMITKLWGHIFKKWYGLQTEHLNHQRVHFSPSYRFLHFKNFVAIPKLTIESNDLFYNTEKSHLGRFVPRSKTLWLIKRLYQSLLQFLNPLSPMSMCVCCWPCGPCRQLPGTLPVVPVRWSRVQSCWCGCTEAWLAHTSCRQSSGHQPEWMKGSEECLLLSMQILARALNVATRHSPQGCSSLTTAATDLVWATNTQLHYRDNHSNSQRKNQLV